MKLKSWLLILLLSFFYYGCATKPGPNLASKASLIKPNQTTKLEITQILGPPVQVFIFPDGKEEWYYYYRVKNFWEGIPLASRYKGEDYTEILKVVIYKDQVVDCYYYTVEKPKKR